MVELEAASGVGYYNDQEFFNELHWKLNTYILSIFVVHREVIAV